jgi:hypothetical protein
MIPAGHISLQAAFKRIAVQEAKDNGRGPDVPNAAAGRLLHELAIGAIQAFRCDAKGEAIPIAVEKWHADQDMFFTRLTRDQSFGDVAVADAAIRAMLTPNQSSAGGEQRGETRGRKPIDRNKLWGAVALVVYEGGGLMDQADTIDKIQQAFERLYGADTAPGNETIRETSNAVMAALREAAKRTGN